jgi:hypothetical protein
MSPENVEAVDAFGRRDPDSFTACLRRDVEREDAEGLRGCQVSLVGAPRFAVVRGSVLDMWKRSDVDTVVPAWNVFWLVDGKIARHRRFRIEDRHDPSQRPGCWSR